MKTLMVLGLLAASSALAQGDLVSGVTADELNAVLAKSGKPFRTNFYYHGKLTEEKGMLWWKVPPQDASLNQTAMNDFERPCMLKQIEAVKAVDWKGLGVNLAEVRLDLVSWRQATFMGVLPAASMYVPKEGGAVITALVHKNNDSRGRVDCNIVTAEYMTSKIKYLKADAEKKAAQARAQEVEQGSLTEDDKQAILHSVEESDHMEKQESDSGSSELQ